MLIRNFFANAAYRLVLAFALLQMGDILKLQHQTSDLKQKKLLIL